jgi:hypothetical protein
MYIETNSVKIGYPQIRTKTQRDKIQRAPCVCGGDKHHWVHTFFID